jgi:polyribonucleotide nucleotidyltransferase
MRGNEIGAIVELSPGRDGMVHVSNISYRHVVNVSDVLHIGDRVKVKVMEVDKERGKISLSMKALEPLPEGYVEEPHRGFDRGPRPGGFRDRGGPRGGFRDRGPRGGGFDRGPRRPDGPPRPHDGPPADYGSGTKF